VIYHNHGASTISVLRGKTLTRDSKKLLEYFLKNKHGSAVVIIQIIVTAAVMQLFIT
jgi:hypothetical protein